MLTASSAKASETLHVANAEAYRFNADRRAYGEGGRSFLLERSFATLKKALGRAPLTIVDHRLSPGQGPVFDLRSPSGAPRGTSQPRRHPPHACQRCYTASLHTSRRGPKLSETDSVSTRFAAQLRIGVAALILLAAIAAACIVMVPAGKPASSPASAIRCACHHDPGLAWKLPAPFESTIPIDLRLRTTSTGLQDVGTRDGLRVLVQAYVAWQVPSDPQRVRQFLRSVRNQPDEAARQLRSFVSAALHITSSNFELTDLVNVDARKVQLDQFEQQLRDQVAPRMLQVYGIEMRQVGIERMTLPDETLAATVARMRAERETVAAERTAEGLRQAAAIRADADRDAREVVAQAREQAAHTEADAQQAAARIYAKAYESDPGLYATLRSLDAHQCRSSAATRA